MVFQKYNNFMVFPKHIFAVQDRSNPDMAFLIRSVELVDSDSATVKTHRAYSVLRGEEQVSFFLNLFSQYFRIGKVV